MMDNYEKKYNEALERARQIKDGKDEWRYSDLAEITPALTEIFPELREDEDERIRTWVLEKVQGYADSGIPCSDEIQMANKALSWLEKQREQKPRWEINTPHTTNWTKEMIDEKFEELVDEYHEQNQVGDIEKEIVDYWKSTEWSKEISLGKFKVIARYFYGLGLNAGEQKPVEKQDYSGLNDLERAILRGFLCAGVENVPVGIIKDTAAECIGFLALIEQKPAEWSEEDCETLVEAVATLRKEGYQILSERLNKLEPKPKLEWSEEDEKMLKCCLIAVNHYEKTCNIGNHLPTKFNIDGYLASVDKVKSWLKSLRPQSKDEIYKEKDEAFKLGKHQLAIAFMNYLDKNRPEGKMSLSNGECEDIDKAFKENDWTKIMRYVEKYSPSWKPSDEQLNALNFAITYFMHETNYKNPTELRDLYEQLKKLM